MENEEKSLNFIEQIVEKDLQEGKNSGASGGGSMMCLCVLGFG